MLWMVFALVSICKFRKPAWLRVPTKADAGLEMIKKFS